MGCRLIEQEDSRAGQQRTRHGKPLPFAAAEECTARPNPGIELVGQLFNQLIKADVGERLVHLVLAGLFPCGSGQQEVSPDGGVEEVGFLGAPGGRSREAYGSPGHRKEAKEH